MPLDPDQIVSLSLAGTVALPSPFPASGPLDIVVQEVEGEVVGVYLKVTFKANRRLTVARIVAIEHVRVVLAAKSLAPDDYPAGALEPVVSGAWVATTSRPLREKVRRLIKDAEDRRRKSRDKNQRHNDLDPDRLADEAIIYVDESAPVLMEVEVSMTAAESANYYPPMAARDSHVMVCDDDKKKILCDN